MCGGSVYLHLPHTCDLYARETLLRAGVMGFFESLGGRARTLFTYAATGPLASLQLPLELEEAVEDGCEVYWRDRAEWWTVRGVPEVRDRRRGNCLVAVIERQQ